jgi:S-adenosylmethionine synthetase
MDNNPWKVADQISDRIVDLINEHRAAGPIQLLAGQLCALKSLLQTSPDQAPQSVKLLHVVVEACLAELRELDIATMNREAS